MPFRQRLHSAFLRFPCGYGGSQFTSRREGSELAPPARVCSPQVGSSDIESAPPPPEIPRIRRTPGVHKNTLNFLGAGGRYSRRAADGEGHRVGRSVVDDRSDGGDGEEEDSGRTTGETKRMFAMGPDDNQPSSLREPGYYDNIDNSILDLDLSQHSQLEDLYRLPSFENSTSDYSSHSITHSIDAIPRISPFSYPERISAKHPSHTNTPPDCFSQGVPVTSIGGDVNDLNLGKRLAGNSSVTSGGGLVCGGDIVIGPEGHPGVIDDWELFKQGQEKRKLMVFKNMDQGCDKEDGQHRRAGLYAAQGITFKQNQEVPVTTTVETSLLKPIVHTRVQPREREEVTNVITRETHTTHIHPTIQPIVSPIYLPQKYYLERVPGSGQLVEITPEQASRSGWDEIWRGSWIVDRDRDMGCGGGVEETRSVKWDKSEMQGGNRVGVY